MKKIWSIICVLFGMTFIAGCSVPPVTGTVVEKEHEAGGTEYNWSKNKWETEYECYELDIVVETTGQEEEYCVSEEDWQAAVEGRKITLTENFR